MSRLEFGRWKIEGGIWKVGVGSWQGGVLIANNLWVACVQRVQKLWQALVQVMALTHSVRASIGAVWVNTEFMNRLSARYTQPIHSQYSRYFPLLVGMISTQSTVPIIRTKV